jgi:hypothetical protein
VIALQADRFEPVGQARQQAVHHLAAVLAAVDIVAQEDQRAPLGRPLLPVVRPDHAEKLVQQIEPAVDVANSVNPLPSRYCGHRCRRPDHESCR